VKTQQVASLQEILLGPAHENDGTFNLFGALATSMATTGYATIREFQKAELVVAPSIKTEGKAYQTQQHVGMGTEGPPDRDLGAAAPRPGRRSRGAVRAVDRPAGARVPRVLGDRAPRPVGVRAGDQATAGIVLSGGPASVYEEARHRWTPACSSSACPCSGSATGIS